MSLDELKKLKKKDIKRFTLKGLKVKAKVIAVHDGDTLDVAFYRNEESVRFNCRLADVDAPELHEENGTLVRNLLAWVCMGGVPDKFDDSAKIWSKKQLQHELDISENLVYAVFGDFNNEKYGRSPVTLKTHSRGKSINKMVRDFVDQQSFEMDYQSLPWITNLYHGLPIFTMDYQSLPWISHELTTF